MFSVPVPNQAEACTGPGQEPVGTRTQFPSCQTLPKAAKPSQSAAHAWLAAGHKSHPLLSASGSGRGSRQSLPSPASLSATCLYDGGGEHIPGLAPATPAGVCMAWWGEPPWRPFPLLAAQQARWESPIPLPAASFSERWE